MCRKKQERIGKIPLSGDRKTDSLFRRIVQALKNRKIKVYRVKIIRDPDNPRKELAGFMCLNHKEIYVIHELPDWPGQQNLIHEALHILFPFAWHDKIDRLEFFLWKHFNDKQKKYLKRFIPGHCVKCNPRQITLAHKDCYQK
ncbi:MAG: hypothetical protein UX07_C0031G0003 [Parcubacteria group bacterium GW2011_GWA2_45_30]|nr:MAG: hypothetical protein UX07_C0031G0003 [Parcubacteria group bacterium GW2011_GWA2_45_30]